MTQEHPITPPPELLQHWAVEYWGNPGESIGEGERFIATQAARWGADQELEACCKWLGLQPAIETLRAVRRPKPPSLKEQALAVLESADGSEYPVISTTLTADQHALIRRALEALPDD